MARASHNPLGQKLGGVRECFIGRFMGSPDAAGTATVLALTALTADAQTVTTGITQSDYARVPQIIGNAVGIVGNVVITGKNVKGETITDTIALNGNVAVEGTKAFKTITSIDLPALTNAGDEVSVGTTDKLGMDHILPYNTILFTFFDGTLEAVDPTLTLDADEIEKNFVELNSALNNKRVDIYYVV